MQNKVNRSMVFLGLFTMFFEIILGKKIKLL